MLLLSSSPLPVISAEGSQQLEKLLNNRASLLCSILPQGLWAVLCISKTSLKRPQSQVLPFRYWSADLMRLEIRALVLPLTACASPITYHRLRFCSGPDVTSQTSRPHYKRATKLLVHSSEEKTIR